MEAYNDNDLKPLRGRIITRLCSEFASAFPKTKSIDPENLDIDPSGIFKLAAGTKDMTGTKFAKRDVRHFILHIPLEDADDLYLLVPIEKLETEIDPQKAIRDSFHPLSGEPLPVECVVERTQSGELSKVTPRGEYVYKL